MDVWSAVAPYYDKASQGVAVFAWIVYEYEIEGHGPALEIAFAKSQGRVNSFIDFEVQDRPGGDRSGWSKRVNSRPPRLARHAAQQSCGILLSDGT
jgi:hypothetical protein